VVDLAREQELAGHHPSLCCIIRGAFGQGCGIRGDSRVVIGKTSSKSPRLLLRLTQHLRRLAPDVSIHTTPTFILMER